MATQAGVSSPWFQSLYRYFPRKKTAPRPTEAAGAKHIAKGTGSMTTSHFAFDYLHKARVIDENGMFLTHDEDLWRGITERGSTDDRIRGLFVREDDQTHASDWLLKSMWPSKKDTVRTLYRSTSCDHVNVENYASIALNKSPSQNFRPEWEDEFLEMEFKMDMFGRVLPLLVVVIGVFSFLHALTKVGSQPEDCPANSWFSRGTLYRMVGWWVIPSALCAFMILLRSIAVTRLSRAKLLRWYPKLVLAWIVCCWMGAYYVMLAREVTRANGDGLTSTAGRCSRTRHVSVTTNFSTFPPRRTCIDQNQRLTVLAWPFLQSTGCEVLVPDSTFPRNLEILYMFPFMRSTWRTALDGTIITFCFMLAGCLAFGTVTWNLLYCVFIHWCVGGLSAYLCYMGTKEARQEFSTVKHIQIAAKRSRRSLYTFIPPNVLARMMEHKDKACRADDKKACRAEDKTARATSHKEVRSKSEELLKAMDATVTTVAVRDLPRSRSDGGGAGEEDACLACSHSHDMGILATEISRCTMMFCALDRRKSDVSGAHGPKSPRQGSMGDEDDWCDDSAEFQRLNAVYVDFDEAVGESGLYKYQHVGPWYIIACPNAAEPFDTRTHSKKQGARSSYGTEILMLAQRFMTIAQLHECHLKVGIHTGAAAGAVIGKLRAFYCIYGDTVNTASRLCARAEAGQIHCSQGFVTCLETESRTTRISCTSCGHVLLKGFKDPIETFTISLISDDKSGHGAEARHIDAHELHSLGAEKESGVLTSVADVGEPGSPPLPRGSSSMFNVDAFKASEHVGTDLNPSQLLPTDLTDFKGSEFARSCSWSVSSEHVRTSSDHEPVLDDPMHHKLVVKNDKDVGSLRPIRKASQVKLTAHSKSMSDLLTHQSGMGKEVYRHESVGKEVYTHESGRAKQLFNVDAFNTIVGERHAKDPLFSSLNYDDLSPVSLALLDGDTTSPDVSEVSPHGIASLSPISAGVISSLQDASLEEEYKEENIEKLRGRVAAGFIAHLAGIVFQFRFLLYPEYGYDLEELGPELTEAYASMRRLLWTNLIVQCLLSLALALLLFQGPLRWTSGISVMLGVARLSWLVVSMCASQVWPVRAYTLAFPPLYSVGTFFIRSLTFRHMVIFFSLSHVLYLGSFWVGNEVLSSRGAMEEWWPMCSMMVRTVATSIMVFHFNVWAEAGMRRRWRLRRVFHTEMTRFNEILNDLLPLNSMDPVEKQNDDADEDGGVSGGGGLECSATHRSGARASTEWCRPRLSLNPLNSTCCERVAVVLQFDMCSFTEFSKKVTPLELAHTLHHVFSEFDVSVQSLNLFKMDTVGDAYIVAAWLSDADPRHVKNEGLDTARAQKLCHKMLWLAGRMCDTIDSFRTKQGNRISGRIGISVGNVVVGALGSLQPRVHIRGKGMREAESLEQSGVPAMLHVSDNFLNLLSGGEFLDVLSSELTVSEARGGLHAAAGALHTHYLQETEKDREEIVGRITGRLMESIPASLAKYLHGWNLVKVNVHEKCKKLVYITSDHSHTIRGTSYVLDSMGKRSQSNRELDFFTAEIPHTEVDWETKRDREKERIEGLQACHYGAQH